MMKTVKDISWTSTLLYPQMFAFTWIDGIYYTRCLFICRQISIL